VDLGAGIALAAAAVNLSMGALHVAIARVPGWRITRLFAAIAFTAAGYNAISLVFSTGGFSDTVYLAAGNLTYLVATIHAVCWILYAYADKHGSLRQAPKFITRLAVAAVLAAAVVTATGGLFYPRVGLVHIRRAGITYHFPLTTLLGDSYGFVLIALGGIAFARLLSRYRAGEGALKWQLVFYCVFLFCAVDEVLVANRLVRFPSLLDAGFVLVVAPLTLHTVRRISNDEQRLRELSGHLKGEVARRTEERDEVRKALQETQEDLRDVVSSLDEIVWEADARSLEILSVSTGAARLLGYPSSDDRRNSFWARYVHPEDRDRLRAEALDALRTNEVVRLEHRMLAADGRTLWFRDSLHPVADPNGNVARLRGVMTDITESRRAHESLVESEERFRKIADAAPVLIWVYDERGQATYVNRQALAFHGRSLEQLCGDRWKELVHAEDRERVEAIVKEAVASPRDYQMEFRQLRADGEYRWMLSTATPRFAGLDYAGHIGTMVDITQHRRDREQGLAAQKLESLGVLAGGVAHDFNNLLGSILANSELLLADLPAGAAAREGIDRINAVAARAAEIVRELMTFAGQENPKFEPVDVSSLVREMLELLKVSISKLAVIRVELADGLPAVMANASQIRQVVMNLITNASEALGNAGGVISVGSDLRWIRRDDPESGDLAEGGYVRLRIGDTGCGMSKEIQDRIFDPFFSTKFSGRGLGLAAVQGIVRSHRGTIQLTSAPGEGASFEILLPCAPAMATPSMDVRSPEQAPATVNSAATVLVVEDEEMLRIAVCRMLRKKGFRVIEAGDGDAALEIIRKQPAEIGVVLLDMTLPGISGKQLFEALRAIRPDVRVILTTAYSKEMATNALGSLQAWGFIRKPYHIADLVAMLKSAEE
jgi:PAS domain S-box-containing protein